MPDLDQPSGWAIECAQLAFRQAESNWRRRSAVTAHYMPLPIHGFQIEAIARAIEQASITRKDCDISNNIKEVRS